MRHRLPSIQSRALAKSPGFQLRDAICYSFQKVVVCAHFPSEDLFDLLSYLSLLWLITQ